MLSLLEFQTSFGTAVRSRSPVDSIATYPLREMVCDIDIPFERRLDVYRNNIHASLIDALESAFPVLTRLVGVEFFRAMGREFLREHMPERGTLIGFGGAIPDFLDGFEPVSGLPYLGDVARLELAWLAAYHAADAALIGADELSVVPPEEMANLHFDLHSAVRTVSSSFPIWSIWQANRGEEKPGAIDLSAGGETVLLLRAALVVEAHNITQDIAVFVGAIDQGMSLGVAVEEAQQASSTFDLAQALQLLLTGGAFVRVLRSPNVG